MVGQKNKIKSEKLSNLSWLYYCTVVIASPEVVTAVDHHECQAFDFSNLLPDTCQHWLALSHRGQLSCPLNSWDISQVKCWQHVTCQVSNTFIHSFILSFSLPVLHPNGHKSAAYALERSPVHHRSQTHTEWQLRVPEVPKYVFFTAGVNRSIQR